MKFVPGFLLALASIVFFIAPARAQNFSVTLDSTSGVGYVYVDEPSVFYGHMVNLWDQPNVILWSKTEQIPDDWEVQICQTSWTCWPGFILGDTMRFSANMEDRLEVKFYAHSVGQGSMNLTLTPLGYADLRQEFTFTFQANPLSVPREGDGSNNPSFTYDQSYGTGGRVAGFRLPTATSVSVDLFDIQGRLLASLYAGVADSGAHQFTLPGDLKTGAYIVRLQAGGYQPIARKVVMMR